MSKPKFTQKEVCIWIGKVISDDSVKSLAQLKDGIAMCKFINKVKPGSVKSIKEGGFASDAKENVENVAKVMKGMGITNGFDYECVTSFAKSEYLLKAFIEFDQLIASKHGWKGARLEKAENKGGPVLSLLEQKQKEVGEKNVKFDRVRHNIIRNDDEEKEVYQERPKDD